MGLYLAIFDDGEEIDGVEVGSYDDFAFLRDAVLSMVEGGTAGARCPTLMLHSDSDGEWTPTQAIALEAELGIIANEFAGRPPVPLEGWKAEVANGFGIKPTNLRDCFFDVDGEPLFERLIGLARLSRERGLSIQFQ